MKKYNYSFPLLLFFCCFCNTLIGQLGLNYPDQVKEINAKSFELISKDENFIKGDILLNNIDTYHFFYDKKGKIVKSIEDSILTKYLTSYNKKENIRIEKKYVDGKIIRITRYHLDKKDHVLMKDIEEPPGVFFHRFVNQNDDKGLAIKTESFHEDTTKARRTTFYKYNKTGMPIEIVTQFGGKEQKKEIRTYDNEDRLIYRKSFDANGRLEYSSKYSFFDWGMIKENYRHPQKKMVVRAVYINNEHNDKIEFFWTDMQSVPHKATRSDNYTYVYDKKGNWIERRSFSNGKPKYIDIRDIQYYK